MKNIANLGIIMVGLLIGGISYWFQPYNQLEILGSYIPLIWSVGAFLGSLLFMYFLKEKPIRIALLISTGFMLAVLVRIIYDGIFVDSADHNLAPIEIMLCGVITIPCSIAGVYLAPLNKKINK